MKTQKELKWDEGKIDWSLVEFEPIEEMIRVLMFGAERYDKDSWKQVEPYSRYSTALMRHAVAYQKGEKLDPDSGLPHMAHIMCNAMFLMYKDKEMEREEQDGKDRETKDTRGYPYKVQ